MFMLAYVIIHPICMFIEDHAYNTDALVNNKIIFLPFPIEYKVFRE